MSYTATPDVDPETEVVEPDWLAAPPHRSRGRIVLLVVLALLLVFLGGVEVEKRWGADDASSLSLPSRGSFPAGGLGNLGSGSDTPTQTSGGTDGESNSTPAVIGTVTRIRGHVWTVRDLGGKAHTVKVTGKTTLTRPITDASTRLRTGSRVTVIGTTRGRTVVATAVTVR